MSGLIVGPRGLLKVKWGRLVLCNELCSRQKGEGIP